MALMESTQLPMGFSLPNFVLRDTVSGDLVSSEDYFGEPLLLAIICNHCPYVVHIKPGLVQLAQRLQKMGVRTLAVSSNDPAVSALDGPEYMAKDAATYGYSFPYLFDEEQSLATSLEAVCTPEFYLFNKRAKLVYRGQMDDARPNNEEPNDGRDVLAAASALMAGAPPVDLQKPSMGCSIKWRR